MMLNAIKKLICGYYEKYKHEGIRQNEAGIRAWNFGIIVESFKSLKDELKSTDGAASKQHIDPFTIPWGR